MHEAAAIPSWVLLAYLVAGVCFIMALRGLSSPVTSRGGNFFGMAGMAIAIATTLASPEVVSYPIIAAAILVARSTARAAVGEKSVGQTMRWKRVIGSPGRWPPVLDAARLPVQVGSGAR